MTRHATRANAPKGTASLWKKATAVALSCLLMLPMPGVSAFAVDATGAGNGAATEEAPAAGTGTADTDNGAGVDIAVAGTDEPSGDVSGADAGAATEGDGASDPTDPSNPTAEANATDTASDTGDASAPPASTGAIKDLDGLLIFPTKTSEDGGTTWVVYDKPHNPATDDPVTGAPADASIKATITLPGNRTALENHYPFLREVQPGEGYYPSADQVKRAVGDYNAYECYMIHWIELDEASGTYNLQNDMELGEGKTATITIEYLKDEAKLTGDPGARKLRVFTSQYLNTRGLVEIADAVEEVRLNDASGYDGFTIKATEPCPYVFVSEKVEKGYVKELVIAGTDDGSAPFDANDNPGNDSGEHNEIVRSYDTIGYQLNVAFGARQFAVTQKTTKLYFELTLSKSSTAARFDTSKMLWLNENYCIEYLDAAGDVIMVQAHNGKYYAPKRNADGSVFFDDNGFAQADTDRAPVSFNGQLSGSLAGTSSYKVSRSTGGVAKQRLVGWTMLEAREGEDILNAKRDFTAAVEVRNADNGEVFQPTFKMWLDGNEENYGPEQSENGVIAPAQPVGSNTVNSQPITVSAGAYYNVQLKKNTDMSYKNWFDFSTGQLVDKTVQARLDELANLEPNRGKANPADYVDEHGAPLSPELRDRYQNYRYGRITCYGIALQLYNQADNAANLVAKQLKGLSLPVGEVAFDLKCSVPSTTGANKAFDNSSYSSILWEYNENVPAENTYHYTYADPAYTDATGQQQPARGTVTLAGDGTGNGGRQLYWDGETRSSYAKGAAPSNFRAYHDGCYYGGDWSLVDEHGAKANINDVASPTKVTGSGADATYHFSVSDYDFDFDTHWFPVKEAGNSGEITDYKNQAKTFSAGCIQVLTVFPRVQRESVATVPQDVRVENLTVKTRAGQTLEARADDPTKIAHESNADDNYNDDAVVLYAPGKMTKGSSFNGTDKNGREPKTCTDGFLGTDYWTTNYDCSAYAGDDIWIVSYGMMSPGSDYRTRSMNVLQLFDSRALSVRGEPSVAQSTDPKYDQPGTPTFLYAMDPAYPEGYDTNARTHDGSQTMVAYMNDVREEDLVYTTAAPDADGNLTVGGMKGACIGVLMEIRGCDILGGKYQYMKIPVKINGDDPNLVGKTVATVNAFRVWSKDVGADVTWANGRWNPETKQNELEGYEVPTQSADPAYYEGQLANDNASKVHYVKTEYEDGHRKSGTHEGGTLAGNSLLILSYAANVNITVQKDGTTPGMGSFNYDQSKGQTKVDYLLQNIEAKASAQSLQPNLPSTTLTVKAVLDEGRPADRQQRMSVASGSYRMRGYSGLKPDGTPDGDEHDIAIGINPNEPTTVVYQGSDGTYYKLGVYATRDATGGSVTFTIKDAPVGVMLPNISFQADFASVEALNENDTIRADAYISGTGDNRAYAEAKGNASHVTVGVIIGGGTNLTKKVDETFIEHNGTVTYHVLYTNSSETPVTKMYFYDLMPDSTDVRGSKFTGETALRDFQAHTDDNTARAEVYYSTTDYTELYEKVRPFGGAMNGDAVEGMNAEAVDDMLSNGRNNAGEELFRLLGTVAGNTFERAGDLPAAGTDELKSLMERITGLYVVVRDLKGKSTITLDLTIATDDNQAGDLYRNIATSWVAGDAVQPLVSNTVQTMVVSREVSGAVWYDANANGAYDAGEEYVSGVDATLFKKGDDGTYAPCAQDVSGGAISATVVTGEDGAYAFEKLAPGDYVVAFKSHDANAGALDAFNGGATRYQVNGKNDENTSDGVALADSSHSGDGAFAGYDYVIQYASAAQDATAAADAADAGASGGAGANAQDAGDIALATIEQIRAGRVPLTNARQMVSHQDLGLTKTNDLRISKTVALGVQGGDVGSLADDVFTFNVSLEQNGAPVSGTFECTVEKTNVRGVDALASFAAKLFGVPRGEETRQVYFDSNGQTKIELSHNETATIKGLPVGAMYTVTEEPYPGYVVAAENAEGVVPDPAAATPEAAFTNTYAPKPATFAPKVRKTAWGALETDRDFSFELALENANPTDGVTMPNNATVTIAGMEALNAGDAGVTQSFDEIAFTRAGTYAFFITETGEQAAESETGWHCSDPTPWTLTVEVADAGGALDVTSATYARNGAPASDAAAFDNYYTPPAPDDPDDPEPVPEDPDDPEPVPDDPDDPEGPSDSEDPDRPADPQPLGKPKGDHLVGTGDHLMVLAVGVVGVAAAATAVIACMLVADRRRKIGKHGARK